MTTSTTKKPAARAPQDRLTASDRLAQEAQAGSAAPAGHELLIPVAQLRSGDIANTQADILDLFADMGIDLEHEGEIDIVTSPATLRTIGKIGAVLEQHVVDLEAFIKFDTGRGAQTRVLELAMWYMAQLGESDGSAI